MPASHILSQQKAWMTSDIFQQWLDKLNRKRKKKGCSIVLFVDNSVLLTLMLCTVTSS